MKALFKVFSKVNCMKQYCSLLLFTLIWVAGFSQNSNRLSIVRPNSTTDDRLSLEQYLWGYSRSNSTKSNKSLIDFNTIDNWRGFGNYLTVNNDGKYFSYTINKPT